MSRPLTSLGLAALLLAGCHGELFRVSGYAQESFSNKADILFVVDNSSSMEDEATAMALNFNTFIGRLTDPTQGQAGSDSLADAVDNYIAYVQARGKFLNYQLAITTTDAGGSWGALYGAPPVLAKGDADVADGFSENLLCTATCFNSSGPPAADPDWECGDEVNEITRNYLDCICGEDVWMNNCGSGQEEGLEAIFMAMCRAVDDPPDACFEDNSFTEADLLSNDGLMRDDGMLIPVIVTDEGDTSRRLRQGEDDPAAYAELFAKFNRRMSFAVIGPDPQVCNSGGATTWGVERYQYFVDETGGSFFPIAKKDAVGDCQVTDFAQALNELGELLNSLLDLFPLAGIPDVSTIRVFVDGEEIIESYQEIDDEGELEWLDGWSYLAAENAVQFHGDAVPDYNQDVRIYYLPLEGMPRELPF